MNGTSFVESLFHSNSAVSFRIQGAGWTKNPQGAAVRKSSNISTTEKWKPTPLKERTVIVSNEQKGLKTNKFVQ